MVEGNGGNANDTGLVPLQFRFVDQEVSVSCGLEFDQKCADSAGMADSLPVFRGRDRASRCGSEDVVPCLYPCSPAKWPFLWNCPVPKTRTRTVNARTANPYPNRKCPNRSILTSPSTPANSPAAATRP